MRNIEKRRKNGIDLFILDLSCKLKINLPIFISVIQQKVNNMRYAISGVLMVSFASLVMIGCQKGGATAPAAKVASQVQVPATVTENKAETTTSWDGPFGLVMGISVKDLVQVAGLKRVPNNPDVFEGSPPKPNSEFTTYMYVATPKVGLCKIVAISEKISTNVYGDALQERFSSLSAAVKEKYGSPTNEYDTLRQGSIWNESRDWMMGLLKKERILAATWSDGKKGLHLPSQVNGIILEALANDTNTGSFMLSYFFKNNSSCSDEMKKSKSSNL